MARLTATGEHKARAARQMRGTAALLDAHHPEMMAGDHLRDAARVLEHGSTDGAKRHLDAAMFMLTPQSLVRHGIRDDDGHADAKHHMHQVNRHRLAVEDIEDITERNRRLASMSRAARGQPEPLEPFHLPPPTGIAAAGSSPAVLLSARTPMLERTPAPRGRPGGPGLYHQKGMGHTAYLQQVVKALIEKRGIPPSRAYGIARASIRKWGARSKHPEVRAAAGRAEAGELARQARAHAHAAQAWEVADVLLAYNPAEPRGSHGEWVSLGGGQVPGKGSRIRHRDGRTGTVTSGVRLRRNAGRSAKEVTVAWDSGDEHNVLVRSLAAQKKLSSQSYAASPWEVADVLIELASGPPQVIDLFNPYHAPPGSAQGGQFTPKGGAAAGQGKGKGTRQQQRQALTRKIAGLHQQIAALQAQLPQHRKSRSSRPARKGAAATSARQARQGKAAAARAGKAGKAATRMSPATIHAKIHALRAILAADIAQLRALK